MVNREDRLTTADRRDTERIPPEEPPGCVIWILDAGFRIDERSEVFLSLENHLDNNYRVHGSGVQEPGFNAILGADFLSMHRISGLHSGGLRLHCVTMITRSFHHVAHHHHPFGVG